MALSSTERTRRWRERHQKDGTAILLELKQSLDRQSREMASFRDEIRDEIGAIKLMLKEEIKTSRDGAWDGHPSPKESFPPLGSPSPSDSPILSLPLLSEKIKKERIITRVFDPRFVRFWESYPKKVGKGAAERSFLKALTLGATVDELLAGVGRYREHNPKDCPWCNPATWLNQERWNDEYGNGIDKAAEYEAGRVEFMRKLTEGIQS